MLWGFLCNVRVVGQSGKVQQNFWGKGGSHRGHYFAYSKPDKINTVVCETGYIGYMGHFRQLNPPFVSHKMIAGIMMDCNKRFVYTGQVECRFPTQMSFWMGVAALLWMCHCICVLEGNVNPCSLYFYSIKYTCTYIYSHFVVRYVAFELRLVDCEPVLCGWNWSAETLTIWQHLRVWSEAVSHF